MALACACTRGSGSSSAQSSQPPDPASPDVTPLAARPGEILEHPEKYAGHAVDLTVVEPLRGPATDDQRTRADYGYYEVTVPEGPNGTLDLVPEEFRLEDEARYRARFEHVVAPPLRIRGEVLHDPGMPTPTYVVRVHSVMPIQFGPPVHISAATGLGDDGHFDRRLVEIEGEYRQAFEVSAIGKDIWVSTGNYRPGAIGAPASPASHVGVLFAKKGAHYGHLGGYRYELITPTPP
jgi:hypothetical protein